MKGGLNEPNRLTYSVLLKNLKTGKTRRINFGIARTLEEIEMVIAKANEIIVGFD